MFCFIIENWWQDKTKNTFEMILWCYSSSKNNNNPFLSVVSLSLALSQSITTAIHTFQSNKYTHSPNSFSFFFMTNIEKKTIHSFYASFQSVSIVKKIHMKEKLFRCIKRKLNNNNNNNTIRFLLNLFLIL